MRFRERICRLPIRTLAKALRCPYLWYEPLLDLEPPCRKGANCDVCIRHMLEGPDPGGGRMEADAALKEVFSQRARERVEEAMKDAP
jgi:hypothetical protein